MQRDGKSPLCQRIGQYHTFAGYHDDATVHNLTLSLKERSAYWRAPFSCCLQVQRPHITSSRNKQQQTHSGKRPQSQSSSRTEKLSALLRPALKYSGPWLMVRSRQRRAAFNTPPISKLRGRTVIIETAKYQHGVALGLIDG